MKVLRPGRNYLLEHECTGWGNTGKGCGALLAVDRSDLRYYAGGGYMDHDPAVSFKCICCGQVTDLGINDWPRNYTNLTKWSSDWADGDIEVNY